MKSLLLPFFYLCALTGCRDHDESSSAPPTPVIYEHIPHSTAVEALDAIKRLSEISKVRSTPLRYRDIEPLLSPYCSSSKVIDMWTSAGIAHSQFDLVNGFSVSIRMSETRAPRNEWVVFELIESNGSGKPILYERFNQK
jgi:hypothetical protein